MDKLLEMMINPWVLLKVWKGYGAPYRVYGWNGVCYYHGSDLTKAVAELNGQVKVAYSNALVKGQGEAYDGYTGDIGPDFEVTGQKNNKPDSGTIRLANSSEVYTLIWTKKPAKESHGIFTLGSML